ncbi:MAG: lactonase family protein [Candidatus Sulfotelmatobacter sp.]|jgi:6-phosphogluconolactonase (cycloisomerase 2 family)
MAAKILLGAASLILAIAMSGCSSTKGCPTATPGSAGGTSAGASGGATQSTGACTVGGGGGGGGNPTATGKPAAFAYYVNQLMIGATVVDTSGNFGQLLGFANPPSSLQALDTMVVAQTKWLYQLVGSQLVGYSINGGTGALTAIPGSPFPLSGTEVASLSTDSAGKFLFVCAANNDEVQVLSINQTSGALAPVGTFATTGFAAQATTDGLGKYLYVTAGNSGNTVDVYAISSTGLLTPTVGSPFSISIATLRSEPTGKFLLGVTGDGANNGSGPDNHVYVFSIDQSTGTPSQVSGSPFPTTSIPADLAVHPNGTLVYTFNNVVNSPTPGLTPVEGFQLDTSSGQLTALAGSPFKGMVAPHGFFDQSGAFLFLHPSDKIEVASVDSATGALIAVGSPVTGVGQSEILAVADAH